LQEGFKSEVRKQFETDIEEANARIHELREELAGMQDRYVLLAAENNRNYDVIRIRDKEMNRMQKEKESVLKYYNEKLEDLRIQYESNIRVANVNEHKYE
jgi:hypothetical protein